MAISLYHPKGLLPILPIEERRLGWVNAPIVKNQVTTALFPSRLYFARHPYVSALVADAPQVIP